MDWEEVIEANRARLLHVLGFLTAAAGLASGGAAATLPRYVHGNVLRILRPAESALRRLIVIAALKLIAPLPASDAAPRAGTASRKPAASRRGPGDRPACFPLIDPRKRFFDRKPKRLKGPGPRVRGLFDDWAPSPPPPAPPHPEDPVSAKRLCQRLQALQAALEDIPGQARRMQRLLARRARIARLRARGPLRFGRPPGFRARPTRRVDTILRDCHWFAVHAERPPDTS